MGWWLRGTAGGAILLKGVHLGWLGISLGERNRLSHLGIGESLERQTHLLVSLEEIRKGRK